LSDLIRSDPVFPFFSLSFPFCAFG
jgi:hypothetical protein